IAVFDDVGVHDGDLSEDGADTLYGGDGDDRIYGGGGDDFVDGGAGADSLHGGTGIDTLNYALSFKTVNVDMTSGTTTSLAGNDTFDGFENVIGTTGDDVLSGDAGANQLTGGLGNDTVIGQGGDDALYGGDGDDLMRGGAGNDNVFGGDGNDYMSGGEGDDFIDGGFGINRAAFNLSASDVQTGVTVNLSWQGIVQDTGHGLDIIKNVQDLSGTIYADTLLGDSHDNWIWGLGGNDTIQADSGNDLIQLGAGNSDLNGDQGEDTASFIDYVNGNGQTGVTVSLLLPNGPQQTGLGAMTLRSIEDLSGSAYNDTLTGDAGANRLAGAAGSDILIGGGGDDILLGDGITTVDTGLYGTAGPIVTYQDIGAHDGDPSEDGNDVLYGGEANDTLVGGGGDDLLHGAGGADKAIFSGNFSDYTITYAGGVMTVADNRGPGHDGTDKLDGVETLVFADGAVASNSLFLMAPTSVADQLLVTRGQASSLSASVLLANDSISPGDTVNVTSIVNVVGATVTLSGGKLSIFAAGPSASFDYIATGTVGMTVGHVTVSSVVTGAGVDHVSTAITYAAADLQGQDGNDLLLGSTGADRLVGGGGDDYLDGGTGADLLIGGTGDDTYIVDNIGDVIQEQTGANDMVRSYLNTYVLGAGLENLAFDGTGAFSGTGNVYNNIITGGAFNDVLQGLDGADTLYGGLSNDALYGGNGNDLLDGNEGNDALFGGDGNDTYRVDSTGDEITETALGGSDTVLATASAYTLSDYLETLTYVGAGAFSGTGSAQANTINGGANGDVLFGMGGDDHLNGGAGADTLLGGDGNDYLDGGLGADNMDGQAGNDTYFVDDAGDTTQELAGGGYDTVNATAPGYALGDNIEVLTFVGLGDFHGTGNNGDNTITGAKGNDTLEGLGGNDKLVGGEGADVLVGGLGIDTLTGGAGGDAFIFQSLADSVVAAGDIVTDFSAAQGDFIDLAAIDANTLLAGDQAFSFLGTGAFTHHAGELHYAVSGGVLTLSGDVNGDGLADFAVRLNGVAALSGADIHP
ncbi:MAG: Hemolysin-type calcium-binding repeat-containing protein, partial [Caulobacter sp.]|nr:Hemolysin-type calcium-binding repeat-containing protein [Caulobacter sp.]